jgi:hypothetical protein
MVSQLVVGDWQPEQGKLLWRAAATEANRQPAIGEHVRDGYLFGNCEGVVQVQADNRRAQLDLPSLPGQVQSQQQRRG